MADAGWYPDPSGAPAWRYFDGLQWTHHSAPYSAPPLPAYQAPQMTPASTSRTHGHSTALTRSPTPPTTLRMDKTPSFCRVKIVALGQLDTTPKDAELLGATVVT